MKCNKGGPNSLSFWKPERPKCSSVGGMIDQNLRAIVLSLAEGGLDGGSQLGFWSGIDLSLPPGFDTNCLLPPGPNSSCQLPLTTKPICFRNVIIGGTTQSLGEEVCRFLGEDLGLGDCLTGNLWIFSVFGGR